MTNKAPNPNDQAGYPLDSTIPHLLWMDQSSIGVGSDLRRLLDKPVKELASRCRAAAVETEGELVQVVVQVLRLNSALMRAQQPSFQQRHDLMNSRQQIVGRRFAFADDHRVVPIAPQPAIGIEPNWNRYWRQA